MPQPILQEGDHLAQGLHHVAILLDGGLPGGHGTRRLGLGLGLGHTQVVVYLLEPCVGHTELLVLPVDRHRGDRRDHGHGHQQERHRGGERGDPLVA